MKRTTNLFATEHVANLETAATLSSGGTRAVTLRTGAKGYIIRIENTGASWYLETIGNEATMCVNLSSGTYCTNMAALVTEALAIIAKLVG